MGPKAKLESRAPAAKVHKGQLEWLVGNQAPEVGFIGAVFV
jgi:hypothetical protein